MALPSREERAPMLPMLRLCQESGTAWVSELHWGFPAPWQ